MIIHVNMYDSVPWCEEENPWRDGHDLVASGAPAEVDSATCHACLDAILKYAGLAMQRKFQLVDRFIAEAKAKKP